MTPQYDDKIEVLSTSDKIGVFPLQPTSRQCVDSSGLSCHEIISLACLVGGIVLSVGREAYGDSLDWMRDMVVREAEATGFPNVDASALDVKFVTGPLGTSFIVVGVFVLVLAAFGILVSTGRFRTLLFVYVGATSLLLISLIVVIMCAYADRSAFEKPVKKMLKKSLEDFTGISGSDATTLGWNAVMMHFNCCGVDDYTDFDVSTNWDDQIVGFRMHAPAACCVERRDPPRCTRRVNLDEKTYYDRGCYEPLFHYVASETALVLSTAYFLVMLEFLCLFFSTWVTCVMVSKTSDKVGVMDYMY
ncbi:tetraspanin [Plakobranchus ocellatus]|uniref:Tetraspanin n=1 Tax=Plakobranchus ocellatus TaxID=259542 RepID=A0AAV4A6K4_9GAST|nr:tetraspanin [Plakobranchus ocellatus]